MFISTELNIQNVQERNHYLKKKKHDMDKNMCGIFMC